MCIRVCVQLFAFEYLFRALQLWFMGTKTATATAMFVTLILHGFVSGDSMLDCLECSLKVCHNVYVSDLNTSATRRSPHFRSGLGSLFRSTRCYK